MNEYDKAIKSLKEVSYDDYHSTTLLYTHTSELELLQELVELHTPIEFINECECMVDYELLELAIWYKAKQDNKSVKREYRITLVGKYPTITIAHQKYRIHYLLANFVYKEDYKGFVIHHKDNNVLNNKMNNLQLLTNSEHISIHSVARGMDIKITRMGIKKAIEVNTRHDITFDIIKPYLNKGFSIKEISNILNCGENTIRRRLKALDWSKDNE